MMPRLFPKSFYKNKTKIAWKHTEQYTGVVMNPVDLITHPRPWIMVSGDLSAEDAEKKTLIFADHRYKYRSPTQQEVIMDSLRKAQQEKFHILVQTPQGVLQVWDGHDLPADYALSIAMSMPESLHHAAWTQQKLSAGDVFVLDYWGSNELLGEVRTVLDWQHFVGHQEDFQALLASTQENSLWIKIPRVSRDNMDQLLQVLATEPVSLFAKKFKGLYIGSGTLTDKHLVSVCAALPALERFSVASITIDGHFSLLFDSEKAHASSPLPSLKSFVWRGNMGDVFTAKDLKNLLRSSLLLESVSVRAHRDFPADFSAECNPDEFSKVKIFNLATDGKFKAQDIVALFQAMPVAQRIYIDAEDVAWQEGIDQLKLAPGSMPELREFHQNGNGSFTYKGLMALQLIAPLVKITLTNVRISGFSGRSKKEALSSIVEVGFARGATIQEIIFLLKIAPFLAIMHLPVDVSLHGVFTQFNPGELNSLKVIGGTLEGMARADLVALFEAASQLECIWLRSCNIGGVFEEFERGQLSCLQVLKLPNYECSSFFKETIESCLKNLAALAAAAPCLRELEFSFPYVRSENHAVFFEQWMPNQFPNLKEFSICTMYGFNRCLFSVKAVKALLAAMPVLEKISFSYPLVIIKNVHQLDDHERQKLVKLGFPRISVYPEKATAAEKKSQQQAELEAEKAEVQAEEKFKARTVAEAKAASKIQLEAKRPVATDSSGSMNKPSKTSTVGDGKVSARGFADKESKSVNFNTQETKQQLDFIEYFPGVHPARYRLRVWRPKLDTLEGPGEFKPADFEPVMPDNRDYSRLRSYVCQPGEKISKHSEGREILLPSLDTEEQLFDLKVFDEDGKPVDPQTLGLEYSRSTQFYRVILPRPGAFRIHFQVALPAPGSKLARPDPPDRFGDLVDKYRAYTPSAKPPQKKFLSLRELAKYVQANRVGSCEHRSIAAFAELESQKAYQGRSRVVINDVHDFLEVRTKGRCCQFFQAERCYPLDLGGYEAKLEKRSQHQAEEKVPPPPPPSLTSKKFGGKKKKKKPTRTALNEPAAKANRPANALFRAPSSLLLEEKKPDLAMLEDEMKEIIVKQSAPALVLAGSDLAAQNFYAALRQFYAAEDIFIAHGPQALSLETPGMTEAGAIKKSYNPFSRWLQSHAGKSGVIVVDIRQCSPSEVAQLNDFLDGKIEGCVLPASLRVLLIDKPERGYYGPDFRRRVRLKATVTEPLQSELLPQKPVSLAAKEVFEIDLFDSPYWQLHLLGSWQMSKKEGEAVFSFYWRPGKLFEALTSGKPIVFKNPPLESPQFTSFIAELKSLRRLHWADQTKAVDEDIRFYQSTGYDWERLAAQASLHRLGSIMPNPRVVLSDTNILSFIEDARYTFVPGSIQLQSRDGYLTRAIKEGTSLDLVCAPGLSQGTLARLLTVAHKRKVRLRFFTPDPQNIPEKSTLRELFKAVPLTKEEKTSSPVSFQLSDDIYFSARKALAEYPAATCFDLSCLEASELVRFPVSLEKMQAELLKTGKLNFQAPLAAIAQQLKKGETVILHGKIPTHLYEALTSLSLGYIEEEPFTGKLIVITSPKEKAVVEAIQGRVLQPMIAQDAEKMALLQKLYPQVKIPESKGSSEKPSFADLERQALQEQLQKSWRPTISQKTLGLSDEQRAQAFDEARLYNAEQALAINPWAMIEGPTGIGKTEFMKKVLPQSKTEQLVWDLKEWLTQKPQEGKNLTLAIDEASFMSQLSGEGENFLERFKSLRSKPPSFLWKGVNYPLTERHKVIFAFNPESYGAGRSTKGFLTEQALAVPFERLPDYYVRARILAPLFSQWMPEVYQQHAAWLTDPLINIYRWLATHHPEESLITPREIKAMVHLICSQAKNINEPESLEMIAAEVAYNLGRQTLLDSPALLTEFEASFKPARTLLDKLAVPKEYPAHQQEAYRWFTQVMEARECLLERFKRDPQATTDLGLGGFVLEGGSGVGKTHFIDERMAKKYAAKGVLFYHVSASTPYPEKENILREAIEKGGIVVAHERNVGLWPNKLTNNALMGLDEKGRPTKTPGFMLWTTQNPPSFAERAEEDPAIRRRMIKIPAADWPVYEKPEVEITLAPKAMLFPASAGHSRESGNLPLLAPAIVP